MTPLRQRMLEDMQVSNLALPPGDSIANENQYDFDGYVCAIAVRAVGTPTPRRSCWDQG